MKKIALLLIATNKYKIFVDPLLKDIEKNFLPGHKIDIHLFNDGERGFEKYSERINIKYYTIPSYGFPEATLLRYKIFTDNVPTLVGYDYMFYMDVDMSIPMQVGDEILKGDIVAVHHPGFYSSGGWGSPNNSQQSTSYIEPEYRKKYFAGGFQGGVPAKYLGVCSLLNGNIQEDKERNVMAEWHDETHWNGFLNKTMAQEYPTWQLNELTPEYCNVPSMHQRTVWGIDHLPGRILALDKNHAEIRS